MKLNKWSDESDKKELLLYLIGADRRKRLEDALSPAKTGDDACTFETFKFSCTKLWGEIDERQALAELFDISQGASTVTEYAAKFKAVCASADLGNTDESKKIILNKFVNGIRSKNIRADISKRLSITDFDAALKRAKLLETIYGKAAQDDVNQVGARPPYDNYQGQQLQQHHERQQPQFQRPPQFYRQPQFNRQPSQQQQGRGLQGQLPRGQQTRGGGGDQQKNQVRNRPKVAPNECLYCHKKGHWKRNCFQLKQRNQSSDLGSLAFDN